MKIIDNVCSIIEEQFSHASDWNNIGTLTCSRILPLLAPLSKFAINVEKLSNSTGLGGKLFRIAEKRIPIIALFASPIQLHETYNEYQTMLQKGIGLNYETLSFAADAFLCLTLGLTLTVGALESRSLLMLMNLDPNRVRQFFLAAHQLERVKKVSSLTGSAIGGVATLMSPTHKKGHSVLKVLALLSFLKK